MEKKENMMENKKFMQWLFGHVPNISRPNDKESIVRKELPWKKNM